MNKSLNKNTWEECEHCGKRYQHKDSDAESYYEFCSQQCQDESELEWKYCEVCNQEYNRDNPCMCTIGDELYHQRKDEEAFDDMVDAQIEDMKEVRS